MATIGTGMALALALTASADPRLVPPPAPPRDVPSLIIGDGPCALFSNGAILLPEAEGWAVAARIDSWSCWQRYLRAHRDGPRIADAEAAMRRIAALLPRPSTGRLLIAPTQIITADDYPPEAMREGARGRVAVVLAVSPLGLVSGCQVTVSSGFASLDTQTCALFSRRARFTPQIDARGNLLAWSFTPKGIVWALPV